MQGQECLSCSAKNEQQFGTMGKTVSTGLVRERLQVLLHEWLVQRGGTSLFRSVLKSRKRTFNDFKGWLRKKTAILRQLWSHLMEQSHVQTGRKPIRSVQSPATKALQSGTFLELAECLLEHSSGENSDRAVINCGGSGKWSGLIKNTYPKCESKRRESNSRAVLIFQSIL